MTDIEDLKLKAKQARLVSTQKMDASGSPTEGGIDAAWTEFTFDDGDVVKVGSEVTRDPDFGMVQFKI